ncbi:MAG: hemerythrin domain-containing protein [Actinobacteria bacterium]|nr:MAG: hemerythrin domain-containing protein [Actinomycetota bacterium]
MADVTEMLEQDHRKVEKLFDQIKASKGAARAKFVGRLVSDLRLHMKVEETIVYPAIVKQADDGKDMIEEAKTEHKGARKALDDVEKLSPDKPGFDGALTMLEAGISHHVEEEEGEVFPNFRKSVSAEELDALGKKVAAAKKAAA